MKTKYIVIGLCAALSMLSCERKSVETVNAPDADIILNLKPGRAFTRTAGSSFLSDTDGESAIDDFRLFFVPDDESSVKEILPAASSEIYGTREAYVISDGKVYVNFAFNSAGDWKIVVVANWPDALTLDASSYSSIMESIYTAVSAPEDIWEDGHFLMVNNTPTEVHLTNLSCDEETPIEVDVEMERVAVKVTAELSETATFGLIGTTMGGIDAVWGISKVEIIGTSLINCVNSFNLFQQWSSGQLVTPSSSASYSMTDGYYDTDPSAISTFYPLGTGLYCLENNSPDYATAGGTHPDASEGTKMKGRVTGILFKVRVKILSQFKSEADTDPDSENLIVDPNPGTWTGTRAGDPEDDETDSKYADIYKYRGICYADSEQLFVQNPDLAPASAVADTTAYLRNQGVSVYEDGYMYYTYWISDPNYSCLAVFRNTWYRVIVDSIATFGDDVPGGYYSATDPINMDPAKFSVKLMVADWEDKTAQNYILQ